MLSVYANRHIEYCYSLYFITDINMYVKKSR